MFARANANTPARRSDSRLSNVRFLRASFAGCALVIAIACGRAPEPAVATPAPLTIAPDATGSPVASASAPAPPLPDGRSFGFIRSVDADERTISFDLAEFLEGDAADHAAAEDDVVEPGQHVENDYYIRNQNPRLRTLHVGTDARIRVVGDPPDTVSGDWDDFAAAFESDEIQPFASDGRPTYRGAHGRYWITVEDADVVLIEEQYVP